jgi:hypothetical protein
VQLLAKVRDEAGEKRIRHLPAAHTRVYGRDEAAPEARLAPGPAPALLSAVVGRVHLPPRRVHGAMHRLDVRLDPIRRERVAVDVVDGRIGGEERVARVQEDGLDQGITCPPSITMA